MHTYDIVGIDLPCVDFALNVPTMPKPNSSLHFQNFSIQGGNKVSTGLVAAARLGAKCAVLGAVGGERFGQFCIDDFVRHGIEPMLCVRQDETTALAFVLSDDETKGRSIVYHPGTCRHMEIDEIPAGVLEHTKYFYLAWIDDTILYAIERAKACGARVFVDADKPTDALLQNLNRYDIFVASEFVYRAMFSDDNYEENCRRVLEMGPEIVIFTFGADGCCGMERNGAFFRQNAFHVDVTDTVGAGDVFHGAFLAGLIRGMTVPEAARFSSAVSAIKCTRIGGRAGIPDYDTAIQFMQTGQIDYTQIDARVRFYEKGFC